MMRGAVHAVKDLVVKQLGRTKQVAPFDYIHGGVDQEGKDFKKEKEIEIVLV